MEMFILNKIIYINNLDDKKYNYCFTFNKTDKYLLFSLKFLYKDKLILDIFNIKSYILLNSINSMYKNSLVFSSIIYSEIWEEINLPNFYILHDGLNQNYLLYCV